MPKRESDDTCATGLSGQERGAIERFLVYIEERVKDAEPGCAELVRMARLALQDSASLRNADCLPH